MKTPAHDDPRWADEQWRTETLKAVRAGNPYLSHDELAALAGVKKGILRQWWSNYENRSIPEARLRLLMLELDRQDSVI